MVGQSNVLGTLTPKHVYTHTLMFFSVSPGTDVGYGL